MMRARYVGVVALVLAGCGHKKVERSDKPVSIATSPPSPATASPKRADGTFTGQDVVTKFGDVQVSIKLAGGRIVDVQWVKLPSDRRRSQFISQQASPILRSEVLAAQSARIDLVSGATYTSDAWASSVQSAINQAG